MSGFRGDVRVGFDFKFFASRNEEDRSVSTIGESAAYIVWFRLGFIPGAVPAEARHYGGGQASSVDSPLGSKM